jgi:formylglycine-generating enzyme required for sulfatase activity
MFHCDAGVCALIGNRELRRSPYGIHDLAGNLDEWVAESDPTEHAPNVGCRCAQDVPTLP